MGANAERKKLFKNISASEEEKKTLKEMQESGVKVYFQEMCIRDRYSVSSEAGPHLPVQVRSR